jgi:hypothetical protein
MHLLPLLLGLSACDGTTAPTAFGDADLEDELEGYEDWAHPAAWPGVEPTCAGEHGTYVQIWINTIAAADIARASGPFSEGALLVNESYQDAGDTPKMITSMRKVSGFDPDNDDWYWGSFDEAGDLVDSGSLPACASCHSSGIDFVRHITEEPPASITRCPGS